MYLLEGWGLDVGLDEELSITFEWLTGESWDILGLLVDATQHNVYLDLHTVLSGCSGWFMKLTGLSSCCCVCENKLVV